ncbi:MAG: tandem-95 repeat protein [Desulfobacteraceae bacterium]|nr:tandem-95 repeat protein [Desulfobacteraceae bacterium]
MAKKLAVKQPKILRYEELEQRVLFSADAVPGLDIDGVHEQVLTEDVGADQQAAPGERGQAEEQNEEAPGPELVFVNGNVADYEHLIANLKESNEDRIIEVVVIESHEDGIGQVTQTLDGRSDLSAVHFITHGANGQISLGNAWLNSTALEQNSHAVAQWGNALTKTGDFLFYGCNIAADSDGQSLLDRISQLTGTDVAASEDMTGDREQGGDWNLEYLSGPVETELSVRSDPQPGWSHLLNVNQGPVNTVPGAQTITRNGMLLFSFGTDTKVSISDPDAGDNPVQVTLTATNGTLNLSGNGGLTFTVGSGTADAAMTFTGTISDINTAMKGMTFVATPGFTGTAGVELTTNDLGQSGTGGEQSATNAITINVTSHPDNALWLSTLSNAAVGESFGDISWTEDEIMQFGNPNFALSQDDNAPETNGTFAQVHFNAAGFSQSGTANINALHYVTNDLVIGGGANTLQLSAGDLLFSTDKEETFDTLTVTQKDVVLFRPAWPGDYSAGTFTMVLQDPANDIEIKGMSLVQQDTTVGSVTPATLNAGDFLFILNDESIHRYEPTGVGQGTTAGTLTEFLEGNSAGVGISQNLNSVHLIEEAATIGGISVAKGDILATVSSDDDLGNNNIAVKKYDVFRLGVESTGTGTSVAQASLLFDGSDVDINSGGEEFDGLSLGWYNRTPQIPNETFDELNEHSNVDEYAGKVHPLGLEMQLSYAIIAGNTDGAFEIGPNSGEICVANSAALVFETTPTFVLTAAAINSQGVYDTATVTIPLSNINEPPIIENNTGLTVDKGSAGNVITTAMLKASDMEDLPMTLRYFLIDNVDKGTLRLNGASLDVGNNFSQDDIDTGKVTYDHGGGDTLDDSFSFIVEDTAEEKANEVPGTFTIQVNGLQINDLTAPVAENAPNGTVVADLNETGTGNDTDLDGNPLTYSITAGNGDGVFTIDPVTGIITIPDTSSLDHDTTPSYALTVEVSNGSGTDTATITVNITGTGNSVGPVSDNNPAGNTVAENANFGDPVGITALATDQDPGDTVTYSLTDDAGGRFAIDSGTGIVTVAGNLDYDTAASHTISVKAESSDGSTSFQDFTINITQVSPPPPPPPPSPPPYIPPANNAPTAGNAMINGLENTVFNGKLPTATDPDGDPITYTLGSPAGNGTAEVNPNGSFSYTPNPDFNGVDTFTYTVSDGKGGTDTGTVTITIAPVNDTPMAADADFNTFEDTVFNGKLPTAADPDGDPISYTLESAPGNGTCEVNPDGSFSYNPNPDFNGIDTFTYTVSDGKDGTDTGTATMEITPVNDGPTAADAGYKTLEDTVCNGNLPVAANPDDDPISYTLESAPGNGTCEVNPDGSFSYTPNPDFNGIDTFTYTVSDGKGGTDTGTVTMEITPVNDGPMAANAGFTGLEDTVLHGNLPRSYDPDGDPVTYTLKSAAGKGTCEVNPDGSFDYTPNPDFNGIDYFTYTVRDGHGRTDTATVTITITPVNDSPIAANAGFNGLEDTVFNGKLPTATDLDGDPLTYTLENAPGNGTCKVNPDGSFSYTPNPDVNGMDTFTYTVRDGEGGTDTATVTITITPVNDSPMAANAGFNGLEDTVSKENLPQSYDPDGDPVTYSLENAAANGTAVVNPDGSFDYTPNPDVNGMDTFTYTVRDGTGNSNTYTVNVHVAPVKDMPVFTSEPVTEATEATAYSSGITTENVDGTPLTISAPTLPAWLTLVDNGDGTATLAGTPTHAEKGDHGVVLEVSNDGLTNTLDFNIDVFVTTTGVTGSDSGQVFNDPETNTEENQPEEDQSQEKPAPAPPAEYKTMPSVEKHPVPEDSTAPEDSTVSENSTVPVKKTAAETTEENIDLSNDTHGDTQPKDRGDDRPPIFFKNDLYREISSLKYSNFNYMTGKNAPTAMDGDELPSLDFNSSNHNRIEINRDYDLMRQQIDQSFETELKNRALKSKLITITSASFTVGIVSYLLRAGSLVASLISSLPVWCGFDPIAIFSGNTNKPKIKKDDIADADELKAESLFDGEAE